MFFLKESEIYQLNKIKEKIESSYNNILSICNKIKPDLDDPGFAYTYAACLLAEREKIDNSLKMFAMNGEDTFCNIMSQYLRDAGAFVMPGTVFESAAPYDVYVQTELYKAHMAGSADNIYKFAIENPPPKENEIVTIMDIGPGNGILTAQFVDKIVKHYKLKKLRLIFIDPFEDMLHTASENCRKNVNADCEVINICCRMQDITEDQIEIIRQNSPVWFINAAISVHHMPKEQKIPMLKLLKVFSSNFILTEVNWNHDLPEKDTPELIYSVANNYGIFSEGILKLPVPEEDRKLCLYMFPVAEAINIIKQDRPNRIDYHTPIEEWKIIGKEAGYVVSDPITTYPHNGKPFVFVMLFRYKV